MTKPPAYGYMRAYGGTSDEQIRADEQGLRSWAEGEGYALARIYQETDEGSVAELTELVGELHRTGTRVVVVPSIEHFGSGRQLQDHLWSYVASGADTEVYEVSHS